MTEQPTVKLTVHLIRFALASVGGSERQHRTVELVPGQVYLPPAGWALESVEAPQARTPHVTMQYVPPEFHHD
jgi:hypothetical protein